MAKIATIDLSKLNLGAGTHSITARSKKSGYISSVESDAVSYVVEDSGTEDSGSTEQVLAAGLYDVDDNLVASWETLTSTYGMDIEKNQTSSTYKTDTASPYYVLTNNTELANGKKLVIDDATASIGDYAFQACTALATVDIPSSVASIGTYAFGGCDGITSVSIPNGATIGDYAFYGCDGITSIYVPESTTFGKFVFRDCNALQEVTFAWGVSTVPHGFVYGCDAITNIQIPLTITAIEDYAFAECRGVESVTIPPSVSSIGAYAFKNCYGLTAVYIGDSVKNIGDYAFLSCSDITDVYYEGTEAQWKAITIGTSNTYLTSATKHYNYSLEY